MSRETWDHIKQTKRFYVGVYRKTSTALIVSCLLNLGLGVILYYMYFNQPDRNYYSTDGVTPPVPLTPLSEPNMTSVPLLAADEAPDDDGTRVIPQ